MRTSNKVPSSAKGAAGKSSGRGETSTTTCGARKEIPLRLSSRRGGNGSPSAKTARSIRSAISTLFDERPQLQRNANLPDPKLRPKRLTTQSTHQLYLEAARGGARRGRRALNHLFRPSTSRVAPLTSSIHSKEEGGHSASWLNSSRA